MLSMTASGGDGTGPWQRYVALGDSFTEGVGDPLPDGGMRGWADLVAHALAGRSPRLQYANLAVRGRRFNRVVAEQVPVAVQMSPDLVSFAAGGNDLLRPGFDLAAISVRFEGVVREIRQAGADLVLFRFADLSRRLPLRRVLHRRMVAMNQAVVDVGQRHGAHVIDLYDDPELGDPRCWCSDRLHLNARGHRRVAELVLSALGTPAVPPAERLDPAVRTPWPAARAADLRWAYSYLGPWVHRRLTGRSSGDGRVPKRPVLAPVPGPSGGTIHAD
jgi:lysophospholipase L1-like esterase